MTTDKSNSSNQLKMLIQEGAYRPAPEQVAAAMLRRPGLRLLFGGARPTLQAGQSHVA